MSNVIRAMFSEVPVHLRGLSLVVMQLLKKLHSDFPVANKMKLFFLKLVRPFHISFPNGVVAGQRSACVGWLMK